MKRITFPVLITLLMFSSVCAQTAKKYQVIKDDSEKIIYLDTKNIRQVDNKISVWSMVVYKQMTQTDEMGRKIGKVKTQYMINRYSKKYSVIGFLVYDEIGRMIKNNSNVNITDNQPTQFNEDVDSNIEVALVFDKALEFLKDGSISSDFPETDSRPKIVTVPVRNAEEESLPVEKEKTKVELTDEMGKRVKENPVVFRSGEKPVEVEDNDDPVVEAAQPIIERRTYNPNNERIVRGVIFTDGNLFVVQKASFRERNRADSEAARLKRLGEEAFVTRAVIPSKGTWYRVRVGYFNSLQEAENYLRRR